MEQHPGKCKEVFALLSAYLDFELPPEACEEIGNHIAGCAPCVEFAETLRRTVDLCRKYKPLVVPQPLGEATRGDLQRAWQKMLAARRSALEAGGPSE